MKKKTEFHRSVIFEGASIAVFKGCKYAFLVSHLIVIGFFPHCFPLRYETIAILLQFCVPLLFSALHVVTKTPPNFSGEWLPWSAVATVWLQAVTFFLVPLTSGITCFFVIDRSWNHFDAVMVRALLGALSVMSEYVLFKRMQTVTNRSVPRQRSGSA